VEYGDIPRAAGRKSFSLIPLTFVQSSISSQSQTTLSEYQNIKLDFPKNI